MLIEHKGDSARLCLQRGCGTGLQIERYLRTSSASRFYLSLYRCGTPQEDTMASRPRVTRATSMQATQSANAEGSPFADPSTSTRPEARRAETAPLIEFETSTGMGSNAIPVASSSRLPEDSPSHASSSKLPQEEESTSAHVSKRCEDEIVQPVAGSSPSSTGDFVEGSSKNVP